jgi:hypothetical protein
LSQRAVDAVSGITVVTVAIRIDLTSRNDRNLSPSGPGHHPPDMNEHPSVISDTSAAIGQHVIPLCVDVDENLPALRPDHLEYHPKDFLSGRRRFRFYPEYA